MDTGAADGGTLADSLAGFDRETELLRSRLACRQAVHRVAAQVESDADARPLAAADLLERSAAVLTAAAEVDDGEDLRRIIEHLRECWDDCRRRGREAFRDFASSFPVQVQSHGLELDASSRHPRYSLDGGLILIEVMGQSYRAAIEPRHGQRMQLPADVDAVVTRVLETRSRLLGRGFDPAAFLHELVTSRAALSPSEGPVPLRELATAVARARGRKKPALDEFLVDLGLLLNGDGFADSEWVPQLQHTRDASTGVHVFGLERGGLVGMIDFQRGDHEG